MKRMLSVVFVVLVGILLLYLSRFWPFEFWQRNGFLGSIGLLPNGDLIRTWLRGTPFAPFDLLIWGTACFLVLSQTEKLLQRFKV